jgi:hypothetical protein
LAARNIAAAGKRDQPQEPVQVSFQRRAAPAKAPIAVYQGDDDVAVDPAATQAYVDQACAERLSLSQPY